ncbi:hypothetical protein C4D60_Mb04t07640 [Musa balbisiana]|uniref:Uncharacterized protein n=1 Tax=Musa balbisiana TaxID=52838 RepID=A0A4S8KAC8_MUSBA|nr:hypothetical protein C4D60_Mb04t07640 [Musa balbisiana]
MERLAAETEAIDRECSPNSLIGRWWEGAMRGTLWERGMASERAASLRSPKRKPRPVQRPYRTCNEQHHQQKRHPAPSRAPPHLR